MNWTKRGFVTALFAAVGAVSSTWGAVDTGNTTNRFVLNPNIPNAGLLPVSGPSWRTCAMFVNWLCNDKRTDLSAIQNGAYDISTFGYNGNAFTDQRAHNPGARYWLPTTDEWIKAGYYDPNYGGAGVGGWWWRSPNGTNDLLIHAPPGIGQSNSAFSTPDRSEFLIPLGAYPSVRSPWGLLDMAGATAEFTESVKTTNDIPERDVAGSYWTMFDVGIDVIAGIGTEYPSFPSTFYGFRVAASVPSPGAYMVVFAVGVACTRRKR